VPRQTVSQLAVKRQRLLDAIRDESDMPKLYAVERQIAAAIYRTDADKLVALGILLERDDSAEFADNFKTKLFRKLQGAA
jgi:hypothetical protein